MAVNDSGSEVLKKSAEVLDGGVDGHTDRGSDYYIKTQGGASSPLSFLRWDAFSITRTPLTDVVEYYSGGLGGTLLVTFTATFTNASKSDLASGVWTTP